MSKKRKIHILCPNWHYDSTPLCVAEDQGENQDRTRQSGDEEQCYLRFQEGYRLGSIEDYCEDCLKIFAWNDAKNQPHDCQKYKTTKKEVDLEGFPFDLVICGRCERILTES